MKKKLKITLAILVAFIFLIAVLAALVISGPKSFPYTVEQAEADSLLASEIVDMISDAIVDENGDVPEIAEITVPAENVNALLRIAAYRLNREIKEQNIECSLAWDNSAVKAVACIPLPLSKAVIVRGSASPVIADGKLNAPLKGLKAGHLPLIGFNIVKKNITANDIEDEKLKLAFEAVHDLAATPDGSLKIGIYPAKISNLTRILIMDEEETKSP